MNEPNPFDSEKTHEPWQEECQRLSEKILLGLSSKRSAEEWEHFKKRTIQIFRDKGLFKSTNP
jgi:hypothetical protein